MIQLISAASPRHLKKICVFSEALAKKSMFCNLLTGSNRPTLFSLLLSVYLLEMTFLSYSLLLVSGGIHPTVRNQTHPYDSAAFIFKDSTLCLCKLICTCTKFLPPFEASFVLQIVKYRLGISLYLLYTSYPYRLA